LFDLVHKENDKGWKLVGKGIKSDVDIVQLPYYPYISSPGNFILG